MPDDVAEAARASSGPRTRPLLPFSSARMNIGYAEAYPSLIDELEARGVIGPIRRRRSRARCSRGMSRTMPRLPDTVE